MDINSSLLSLNQLYSGKGRFVNNQLNPLNKQSANTAQSTSAQAAQQADKNYNVDISNAGLAALQNQSDATANLDTGIFTSTELSSKAQSFLEKLQEKYGDYNFVIVDDIENADIQSLTAGSDKKYSVVLTSEELEKMANDEEYANSMMGKVEDAVKMADNIMEKADLNGKAQISQLTISFDADGNTKLFATLEKLSESQQKRLDAAKEKAAEESDTKQTAQPEEEEKSNSFTIDANTEEDFLEQLKNINWDEMFNFDEKFATE